MNYPRTDDEWVRLAECIVTKTFVPPPEEVGALSVAATETIFSWYKGDERIEANRRIKVARDIMIELGIQTGCLHPQSRQLAESGYPDPTKGRAMRESGSIYVFEGWTYTTVGRTQMRGRNTPTGIEIEQVSVGYDQLDIDTVTKRITEALGTTGGGTSDRLFPQTYGDWVNLAESMKEIEPVNSSDYDEINFELGVIGGFNEGDVDESKRWLMEKARELGIK